MTRTEQTAAALKLLGDPARRADVEAALDIMESAAVAALHAVVTKKALRAYGDALRRMRSASAAARAAGVPLALKQDVLDCAVKRNADWQAHWKPPSPWLRQQYAVALAHDLLSPDKLIMNPNHKGTWHTLARILLGDPDADLYRQMRAYARAWSDVRARLK